MLEVPDHVAISFFQTYVGGVHTSGVYYARCPICGDSQKNKRKKRFYLLKKDNYWGVYCHNCGIGLPFLKFISDFFPDHYDDIKRQCIEYSRLFSFNRTPKTQTEEEKTAELIAKIKAKKPPKIEEDTPLKRFLKRHCFPLDLNCENPSYQKVINDQLRYLLKRKLKPKLIKKFYYCYGKHYTDRLIIPFYDPKGEPYYFQARSTKKEQQPKYLNWKDPTSDDESKPLYNEPHVNKNETVFIVEGLLDSIFIDNSVSVLGAHMGDERVEDLIKKFPKRVFCLDNDIDGWKTTEKLFKKGEKCLLFPCDFPFKDLNDLAIDQDTYNLTDFVKSNVYEGYNGLLNMVKFRRTAINKDKSSSRKRYEIFNKE